MLRSGREAGTPAAAAARETIARHLRVLGWTVDHVPFDCTPASLLALPFVGAALGWLSLLMLPLLTAAGPSWAPMALWVLGLFAAGLAGSAIGLGWTTLGQPARVDANLVARHGDLPVRRWVVAHLDTKAQGHSTAGRLVALWLGAAAISALTTLSLLRLLGTIPLAVAAPASALGIIAGYLFSRARLRGQSPGARDNGTGLCACLTAAAQLGPGAGVIITSAEEFGLLGARALVAAQPDLVRGCEVINLDTLDDRGALFVVHHDAKGHALAERLASRLALPGVPVVRRRLPFGVLTDSLVFARAGAAAVTVARLDWSTLRVMHTPGDTLSGLSFDTAIHIGRRIDLSEVAA